MPDMLQSALSALPKLIPRREVGYRRGSVTITIKVTVGRSKIDYADDDNNVRRFNEVRDYLIVPALLVISGSLTEPKEGDIIIDDSILWRVVPEAGEFWRYTDRYHTMFRVHVVESDDE